MTQIALIPAIRQLVYDLPEEWAVMLARLLQETPDRAWSLLHSHVQQTMSQPDVAHRVDRFLRQWQYEAPDVSSESAALALLAAADMETFCRANQQLELVWSGPDSQIVPLRRTDQALLQLINNAKQHLHIVSFAVYKVANIAAALVAAANRGVQISLYLETEGQIAYDTVQALGSAVTRQANVYIWPLAERLLDENGRHGSLHAKLAIADGQLMLVSSANLTQYAMTLNMEVGLLVRGGLLPIQMEQHLNRLIETNVFRRY